MSIMLEKRAVAGAVNDEEVGGDDEVAASTFKLRELSPDIRGRMLLEAPGREACDWAA